MNLSADEIAQRIEHTLLKPEATPEQVDRLCEEVLSHGFHAACVHPVYVSRAAQRLAANHAARSDKRTAVVVSVAGFPLGSNQPGIKADEARRAMDEGALEIDMVAHLGALVAGDRAAVRRDIEAVARVVHSASPPGILKVILETSQLTSEQLILGCRCCAEGEADFVKTSTGFHPTGGATVEHVRQLRRHAAPMRVKAAGGIKTASQAVAMLDAGADRIGTSAGVAIIAGLRAVGH